MELYRVEHGSHLYGLDHAGSDLDTYIVLSGKGKSKQTIKGNDDLIVHSLDSFLIQAHNGVPQALEAMFAPSEAVSHSEIDYLRNSFVATGSEVIDRYVRTIYNFSLGDSKRRTHGARLAFNLRDLISYGRFNPKLDRVKIGAVRSLGSDEFWSEGFLGERYYRSVLEDLVGFEFFDIMDSKRKRRMK